MKAVKGKEKFIVRIQSHIRKYKVRKVYKPKLNAAKNPNKFGYTTYAQLDNFKGYENDATTATEKRLGPF
jgi:hypothetical protein